MERVISFIKPILTIKSVLLDLLFLTFIYFVPALTHLISLPVYFIEPMRLMLVFAILHTSRNNAFLIALTLPIFSYLISAHPSLIKSGLISIELFVNTLLFFQIVKRIPNAFWAMMIAVLTSKLLYYGIKFSLLNLAVMEGSLVSTPLMIQVVMMLLFSGYAYQMLNVKGKEN
jgi:hypothetical protein